MQRHVASADIDQAGVGAAEVISRPIIDPERRGRADYKLLERCVAYPQQRSAEAPLRKLGFERSRSRNIMHFRHVQNLNLQTGYVFRDNLRSGKISLDQQHGEML